MTPERWQQVKQIFNSAIQYPPQERDSFLSDVCLGDDVLRSEVESLIASHEQSGEFIDQPAYQAATWLTNEKSELSVGQKIGTFEVLSFISRGGMGEVYLAQDQRLNRKVALKLLPASFTKDNDRLRRFAQEARAASALNHPNIITIYEIQELNSSHVIATEFVEGETLRQRMNRAPLSLSETLNISIQISDALSAAHKAGIIHRDIKPENVMLRPDGYVKVLDFGLAKLSEHPTASSPGEAPTIQVRTGSGIVMGTAGYMSPEQARGLIVDERSDIFSLGALLYEMVARRKPFEGETGSDILASILKTEPPPLSRVVPGLPSELVRIVTKTLRKDREERYQVVKDLWLDLKSLKQELEFQEKLDRSIGSDGRTDEEYSAGTTSILPVAQTTEPRSAINSISESLSIEMKRHKLGSAMAILAMVLIVVAAGFGIYKLVGKAPVAERFWEVRLSRITNSGNAIDATISPDGKYIVYVLSDRSSQSLYIRQVSTANDKQIVAPAPVGFFGMTFSPDGTELFYAVKSNLDNGALYRIPVLGGTPVKILQAIDCAVSFSPDGKRFVFVRGNYPNPGESALVVANIDGSDERNVTVQKIPSRLSPIFFTGPSWSPDNKIIAASVTVAGGRTRIAGFNVEDGAEKDLSTERWPFAARVQWLPDMSGLLAIAGETPAAAQVWVISYPGGKARRITNDLGAYRALGLTSDGKKLSTIQATGLLNLWVVPSGDAKRAVRLPMGNIGFYASVGSNTAWTADGRIVFVSNEGTNPDIWLTTPDGSDRKQLTSNGGANFNPTVSPDGRYIVYSSVRESGKTIWRMNGDGSNPIKLTNGAGDSLPSVSPDSKWVVFTTLSGTGPLIWKVSIDGGTPVQVTDHAALGGIVSPDGKWIAFLFAQSADPFAPPNRLALIPFEGGEIVKTFEIALSGTVGTVAQWSQDGKSILYSINSNNVSNIWSQSIEGGPPKQITEFTDSLMTSFAWSRDGKQLVCARGQLLRDAVLITDLK